MSVDLTHLDVPRDYVNNMRWRVAIREWAMDHPDRQAALRYWCSRDFRLFVNGFCWVYEPRDDANDVPEKVLPFILWENQDLAVDTLLEHLGREDIGFDKTRGEGASWLVLMAMLWRWRFRKMNSFGLVSKTEYDVDNPDNPDSLMWKLDWALDQLPGWMVPRIDRNLSKHTLVNLENGSQFVGYSATGDVARGGRKTAIMMDELASFPSGQDQAAMDSTQHVTNCRVMVSTPKGPFGVFYNLMHSENSLVKISLKWQQNPNRKRGLYRVKAGRPVLIDWQWWRNRIGRPELNEQDIAKLAYAVKDETDNNAFKYRFMLTGPYVKDGKDRSPWYDRECRRPGATPRGIAQELDLDYTGTTAVVFDISTLEEMQKKCLPPRHVGDLLYDDHPQELNLRWSQRPGGMLHIWVPLNPPLWKPPGDRPYTIGADIASGLGGSMSSNSCLWVTDCRTNEQAAMFASPRINPERLAWMALALAHFFAGPAGPCRIIPEANGTWGITFIKLLRDLGYTNIYRRESDDVDVSTKRKAKYGFWSDKNTKPPLLMEWYYAVVNGEFKVRDKMTLEEAKHYVLDDAGVPVHQDSMSADDPSGAKGNHGDRVIASALSWRGRKECANLPGVKSSVTYHPNSVAGRFENRMREQKASQFVW